MIIIHANIVVCLCECAYSKTNLQNANNVVLVSKQDLITIIIMITCSCNKQQQSVFDSTICIHLYYQTMDPVCVVICGCVVLGVYDFEYVSVNE